MIVQLQRLEVPPVTKAAGRFSPFSPEHPASLRGLERDAASGDPQCRVIPWGGGTGGQGLSPPLRYSSLMGQSRSSHPSCPDRIFPEIIDPARRLHMKIQAKMPPRFSFRKALYLPCRPFWPSVNNRSLCARWRSFVAPPGASEGALERPAALRNTSWSHARKKSSVAR